MKIQFSGAFVGFLLAFFVNFFFPLSIIASAVGRFIDPAIGNNLNDLFLLLAAIGAIYLVIRYFRRNLSDD